jgi:hypothetical protein
LTRILRGTCYKSRMVCIPILGPIYIPYDNTLVEINSYITVHAKQWWLTKQCITFKSMHTAHKLGSYGDQTGDLWLTRG